MNKVILRLKSGREFVFECESYSLHTLKLDGRLCDFTYEGGIGECPIWFSPDDVEAIAVVRKGGGMTMEEAIEILRDTPSSVIRHCCNDKGDMCEYANENGYCRKTACAYRWVKQNESQK